MKDYYLYLIWQDPNSRRNFTVGKLTHNEKYIFAYVPEAKEAKKFGWEYLKAFPENKEYISDTLFPAFSSRLPDRKRRDIGTILKKYSLDSYDDFELLRRSGAKLPIDTYRFIDPIFPEDESIQRDFFIMGVHYYVDCANESYKYLQSLVGKYLSLIPEPENEHDPNAIYIADGNGKKIGYVPRYYSTAILNRINAKFTYSCVVTEVNQAKSCSECVKVRLNIPSII